MFIEFASVQMQESVEKTMIYIKMGKYLVLNSNFKMVPYLRHSWAKHNTAPNVYNLASQRLHRWVMNRQNLQICRPHSSESRDTNCLSNCGNARDRLCVHPLSLSAGKQTQKLTDWNRQTERKPVPESPVLNNTLTHKNSDLILALLLRITHTV